MLKAAGRSVSALPQLPKELAMQIMKLTTVVGLGLVAGCGDNGGSGAPRDAAVDAAPDTFPTVDCTKVTSAHCVQIASADAGALQTAANSIDDNTTIVLASGTYKMTNSVTLRNRGVHLIGQGIDLSTLDFGSSTAQGNGVDAVGDDFLIQDLTVRDSRKDGIRVEASAGVVFRRIRSTWTTPSSPMNGAYGIYPVKSSNVLVEDSRAENASDAGLYVGQCQHVIVRNNVVTGNVAGLEIENTEYADVYGNTADDNTGGIVVFDLPGNPIVGRDTRLRNNTIKNNNHVNFASGGTVASIPSGTGTFAMASRRVEITGNTYTNNNTVDIALISGLAIEPDPTKWVLDTTMISGTFDDLGLLSAGAGTVMNFRGENILVANNTHAGSGTAPDARDLLQLGFLLAVKYGTTPVDSVLYDAIGETFDYMTPRYSNDNHMCVGGNTGGTFAALGLEQQVTDRETPFYRPASPFVPYDCTMLAGGPVAAVVLP
jgi:parallel beta-helix repeat protein